MHQLQAGACLVSLNYFCADVGMRVCVCVCSPLRLLITSGMIWTLYDWLNKFCMATVVIIGSSRGLRIEARRRN